MNTVRCKHFTELGMADFVFPIDWDGYIKLYEREEPHTYSVDEINTILDTEWWYYVLTPWDEFLFFGTRQSPQKRNVDAEAYCNSGWGNFHDNFPSAYTKKVEFYGNVLSAAVWHVNYANLLKCRVNLQWREHVLQRNHDVFYPVASNRKSRELTPAKDFCYSLEELQKLVGGYIDLFPADNDHWIVCHEVELQKKYPCKDVAFNAPASVLAQKLVFGNALLIKKTRLSI